MMDAARVMTAGAVDMGEKPSVTAAIGQYHPTERGRQAINDAMDIYGRQRDLHGPEQLPWARLSADSGQHHR